MAVDANTQALIHATEPQLRALLPVLQEAERELTVGITRFLKATPGSVTFDLHRYRALLGQTQHAIAIIDHSGGAVRSDLIAEGEHAMSTAWERLRDMVHAGQAQFEGAITPLRLDVASVGANTRRMVLSRFEGSARRWGGEVGREMRSRFMLGVVRGETVDQLVGRMLASTRIVKVLREAGPSAVGDAMAAGAVKTIRARAERLVHTELVNAYNVTALDGLKAMDREDRGYWKRWDAAADRRVCILCASLDGAILGLDISFRGGVDHPPLHPFCRCAIVPWREGWNL